jgi:hypothetical protein
VGAPEEEEDEVAFEEKMAELTSQLAIEMSNNAALAEQVREVLGRAGHEL